MTSIGGFSQACQAYSTANTTQCWIYRARRPVENNLETIRNLIAETRELIQKNEIDSIEPLSIWKIQENYELIAAVIQLVQDGFEVDKYQIEKLKQNIHCLAEFPFTNIFNQTISDLPEPLSCLAKFYTQLRHLYLQELSDILGRPVQIPTPQPAPSSTQPLPIRLFHEAEPEIKIPLERPRTTGCMPTEQCVWNRTQGHSMISDRIEAVSQHIFQANDHRLPKMCARQTSPGINSTSPTPDCIPFYEDRVGNFSEREIAKHLWLDPETPISDFVQKVNVAAVYLKKYGFELRGVSADGNCYCRALLKSYKTLSRKLAFPEDLRDEKDQISHLRVMISYLHSTTPKGSTADGIIRAQQIKQDREWIHAEEGDLLATALSIPIRTVTVDQGVNDMLTGVDGDRQEWDTIDEQDRPKEYLLIVDLGGHFISAQAVKAQKNGKVLESPLNTGEFLNKTAQEQARINKTQDGVLQDLHKAIDQLISQTQQLAQKLDLDTIEYLSIWKIQENYELIAATIKLIQEGFQLDEDQIDKLAENTLSLADHSLAHTTSCDLPAALSHLEELYSQLRDLYLKEVFNISQRPAQNPEFLHPQSFYKQGPKISMVHPKGRMPSERLHDWASMMPVQTQISGMQSALERINQAVQKILEMLIASARKVYQNINKNSSKGE